MLKFSTVMKLYFAFTETPEADDNTADLSDVESDIDDVKLLSKKQQVHSSTVLILLQPTIKVTELTCVVGTNI